MREFFTRLTNDPATMRKFLVVFGAAVAALISQGLLNGTLEAWANAIIMFLGAIGVYKVPNAPDTFNATQSRLSQVKRGEYGYTELTLILLVAAVVLVILCLVGVL